MLLLFLSDFILNLGQIELKHIFQHSSCIRSSHGFLKDDILFLDVVTLNLLFHGLSNGKSYLIDTNRTVLIVNLELGFGLFHWSVDILLKGRVERARALIKTAASLNVRGLVNLDVLFT